MPHPPPLSPHYNADLRPTDHALGTGFAPCACGTVVLIRVWSHDTGWRVLPVPVSCVTGEKYQCNKEVR